jgi:hypothetical protein
MAVFYETSKRYKSNKEVFVEFHRNDPMFADIVAEWDRVHSIAMNKKVKGVDVHVNNNDKQTNRG